MNLISVLSFCFGLIIGSFLNVIIRRLPAGESLLHPPSHCPDCKYRLSIWELVPLLSYLGLRGRCSHCKTQISLIYPVTEVVTGLVTLLVVLRFGITLDAIKMLCLFYLLLPISVIDWRHFRIPDKLTITGILAGVLFSFIQFTFVNAVLYSSLGILTGAGVIVIMLFLGKLLFRVPGMGGGDIKFAAMVGTFLGWQDTLLALFLGILTGAINGLFAIMLKKARNIEGGTTRPLHQIPFGPALSTGAVMVIFWGNQIIGWYLSL